MHRRSVPIHLIRWAAIAALLGVAALYSKPIRAEDPFPHHAGIVIQFGDGAVHKACVDLGEDGEATGMEVLGASGVSVAIEYSGMGGTVCRINTEGCSFPSEVCFCQCTLRPGDPCVYWAYYHLIDNQWEYAQLGFTSHTVRPGEVDGWAWGEGIPDSSGAIPPVFSFDQICIPPTPTPTHTPSPTDTPTAVPATATPTATPIPPTLTPKPPTATPSPTTTPTTVPPTATRTATSIPPSSTPRSPTATSITTRTATPRPSNTPVQAATATPAPSRAPALTATRTATPRVTAASTHTPAPTSTATPPSSDGGAGSELPEANTNTVVPAAASTDTPEVPTAAPAESMTPIPTPSPYAALGINTRTPMPTAIPKEAIARAALATSTRVAVAPVATNPSPELTVAPSPTNVTQQVPENTQGGSGSSYLLFGVLAAGLMAGLVVLRIRRRL